MLQVNLIDAVVVIVVVVVVDLIVDFVKQEVELVVVVVVVGEQILLLMQVKLLSLYEWSDAYDFVMITECYLIDYLLHGPEKINKFFSFFKVYIYFLLKIVLNIL